jgi:hypothetical protein
MRTQRCTSMHSTLDSIPGQLSVFWHVWPFTGEACIQSNRTKLKNQHSSPSESPCHTVRTSAPLRSLSLIPPLPHLTHRSTPSGIPQCQESAVPRSHMWGGGTVLSVLCRPSMPSCRAFLPLLSSFCHFLPLKCHLPLSNANLGMPVSIDTYSQNGSI